MFCGFSHAPQCISRESLSVYFVYFQPGLHISYADCYFYFYFYFLILRLCYFTRNRHANRIFSSNFFLFVLWSWLESNVVDLEITLRQFCNHHKSSSRLMDLRRWRSCSVLEVRSGANCTKKKPRILHFLVARHKASNFLFWPRRLLCNFSSQNCTQPAANPKIFTSQPELHAFT